LKNFNKIGIFWTCHKIIWIKCRIKPRIKLMSVNIFREKQRIQWFRKNKIKWTIVIYSVFLIKFSSMKSNLISSTMSLQLAISDLPVRICCKKRKNSYERASKFIVKGSQKLRTEVFIKTDQNSLLKCLRKCSMKNWN
jgi:hypothetical protein